MLNTRCPRKIKTDILPCSAIDNNRDENCHATSYWFHDSGVQLKDVMNETVKWKCETDGTFLLVVVHRGLAFSNTYTPFCIAFFIVEQPHERNGLMRLGPTLRIWLSRPLSDICRHQPNRICYATSKSFYGSSVQVKDVMSEKKCSMLPQRKIRFWLTLCIWAQFAWNESVKRTEHSSCMMSFRVNTCLTLGWFNFRRTLLSKDFISDPFFFPQVC